MITVILKAAKFDNPATTQVLNRHELAGDVFRVIEYPADKYFFEYDEKFSPVLPEKIPHAISALSIEDNSPVLEVTLACQPGVFVLDTCEHSTVTVNFNKRTITVEHDRIFGDHRIQLNFHYRKET